MAIYTPALLAPLLELVETKGQVQAQLPNKPPLAKHQ